MGEKGDEEQCLAFLNAVLADSSEKPLRLVRILENRSVSAENLGDKSVAFDFRALGETDTRKNIKAEIEVQLKDLHNMTERTLYYWAREYVAGIKEGEDYGDLPRVITINIVNFDYVKLEKFHTTFRLREDVHHEYVLTDVMGIHFLNMVKFRRKTMKSSGRITCSGKRLFPIGRRVSTRRLTVRVYGDTGKYPAIAEDIEWWNDKNNGKILVASVHGIVTCRRHYPIPQPA
jgi:predicted transposase/invertase (TIGR01784 family)